MTTKTPATPTRIRGAGARRRAAGRGSGDLRWRGRQAHARADAVAAAPARSVPDARCVRHRQSAGLHRRVPRPSAPRLRDRHVHDRRAHAPSRQRGPRRPAVERRRAVDDRRQRRRPFRAARAGRRPDGRLPAVAQPAGEGQDARAVVPRHPERRDSGVHDAGRRCRARDRRREPWCRRRGAARGYRAAVSRPRAAGRLVVRAGAAGGRTTRLFTSTAVASTSARRTCRRSGWRFSATARIAMASC